MAILRSRLFFKIMTSYLALLLAVLLVVDFFMARRIHQSYLTQEKIRLKTTAKVLSEALPEDQTTEVLQPWVRQYGDQAELRITLINSNGQVLADNQFDPAQMDNHANSPEIQQALQAGMGSSIRFSRTLGKKELYLAYRVSLPDQPHLILRLALPLREISDAFRSAQRELLFISLFAILLALGLGYFFTRSLVQRMARIQEFSENVARGNLNARVKDAAADELGSLARSLNTTAGEMQRYVNELMAGKNRIAAILEGMRAGVLATDAEGRVTLMNSALARILEVGRQETLGKKVLEIIRNAELKHLFDKVLSEKKELRANVEIMLSPARIIEVVAVPLYEATSFPVGVVAVLHDITRLKELEKVRKDFVANVSHELRTPLTSIRGFAETLLEGALEDQKNNRRFVEIIRSHAVHLSNLTMDLLALAALEADSFSLNYEPVDLKILVEEVIECTKTIALEKKQRIHLTLGDGLPVFQADREKLRQVFINLLDNAIKFTPEEGKISVEARLSADGGSLEVHVRDNGIGIPSSDLPRIFERFYRVDQGRSRKQGGTGLGLAIVKHIVEAHKGKLQVRSVLGQGSDFGFVLPIG